MDRREFLKAAAIAGLALNPLTALALDAPAQPRAKGTPVDAFLAEIPKVTKDRIICFCLYTVNANILKLTAQLYPIEPGEPRVVRLEVKRNGEWKQIATANVIEAGWTATFRVTGWDMTKEVSYRVRHGGTAIYDGIIRRNPMDKEKIVVAALSCDSIYPAHGGTGDRKDIVDNIKRLKPDLLFFAGDQVYSHNYHYTYWLTFGRNYGEVIRQYPTITIPDDHDVGNPNFWGAGGKASLSKGGVDGGYLKPADYVKEVHRAQTSHLPDPYDPTPVQQGISVYYTSMNWGGISFAILEDRKWKSGPEGLVPLLGPRVDHVTTPEYDPKQLDPPGARLLGDRQIKFLRQWAADWRGADMKCVLSQTMFCCLSTHNGTRDYRTYADLDSNGWPHTGRNRALEEMRKCFAVHIAGDQHLASVVHHGIDEYNDSIWAFCTPAVACLYKRWWEPDRPGANRKPGASPYAGEYTDGFGNRMTVMAVANPAAQDTADKLTSRATGWAVVTFDKKNRTVRCDMWPRKVDILDLGSKQYPGWPITVNQLDNYGRKAAAYLPVLRVRGMTNPIVQVIDEKSGEIVYTLRIRGIEFRPKVFHDGTYTIKVGDQMQRNRTLRGVRSLPATKKQELVVRF